MIMPFINNKNTTCEYTLKEHNLTLEINLKTKKLDITDTKITIDYIVEDSENEYIYQIEMSDNL